MGLIEGSLEKLKVASSLSRQGDSGQLLVRCLLIGVEAKEVPAGIVVASYSVVGNEDAAEGWSTEGMEPASYPMVGSLGAPIYWKQYMSSSRRQYVIAWVMNSGTS